MPKPDNNQRSLRELKKLPGVGPRVAEHLLSIGIRSPADLEGQSPEKLFARFNRRIGRKADPCLLYAFRCAVHYVTNPEPAPRLLKWWNWKNAGKTQD